MIDAREVVRGLKIPLEDETEIQRLGAEIVGMLRDPERFDGTSATVLVPIGRDEEQQTRSRRIVYALQRRFGAQGWIVMLDGEQNEFGEVVSHRLTFMLDPMALRDVTAKVAPKEISTGGLRALHRDLLEVFGGEEAEVKPLPEKVDLSILLGTYNRKEILKRAIKSFRKASPGLIIEIIVCDGGSTDGSREWLARQSDVVLVGERRLEGAVKAFNQAFALSRGEFVANMNDDCIVHGTALADGVAYLKAHEGCGQVAFSFSGAGQPKRGVNEIFGKDSPKPVSWGTVYANFGITHREVADKVARIQGGFWNPCYRTYAGDCEHSAWVWKLGYTVDKMLDCYVEDVWAEDDLRAKNKVGSGAEARLMYERWNDPAMFKPEGPLPNVSAEEIARYYEVRNQSPMFQEELKRDLVEPVCFFPEPQEERRLVLLAPRIRALDPNGTLPKRAEQLSAERVLHVGLCTDADPQAGLVRALKGFGDYREIRWFADYKDDAEARQSAILGVAFEQKPTLVFLQVMQGAVDSETVRKIRDVADPSCVVVAWSGDVAYDQSPWHLDGSVVLGRSVDLMLHSSMTHVRLLRAAGVHNAGYLQIGFDQEQYHPPLRAPSERDATGHAVSAEIMSKKGVLHQTDIASVADDLTAVTYGDWRARFRSYDVAFLGSHYGGEDAFSQSVKWHDGGLRDEVVAKMKEAFGWKFCLYGKGWGKSAREMPLKKAHEVYQRAKVGLSVSLMNDLECYSSDRLHRIVGCGALGLVRRFPGMDVWGLVDGLNCVAWDTAEEAVALAKACLDEKTDSIRKAGAEIARENWTWEVRMRELAVYVDAVREARK